MSKDIKQVIKVKTAEMSRMTPLRLALMKAIEPKKEKVKEKKTVNVCYIPQQVQP